MSAHCHASRRDSALLPVLVPLRIGLGYGGSRLTVNPRPAQFAIAPVLGA